MLPVAAPLSCLGTSPWGVKDLGLPVMLPPWPIFAEAGDAWVRTDRQSHISQGFRVDTIFRNVG